MKTTLPNLFKSTRLKLHLSQEKMACLLGVTRVSVSNYERGEMTPGGDKVEIVMKLAKSVKEDAAA